MASDGTYFDTDTKLMLHMDGADTSTTFTDSSTSGRTMTAVDNAQIDTAQSVFGGASGLFDGTGDFLTAVDSDDFYLSGDFTIDFRLRFSSVAATKAFFSQETDGDNRIGMNWTNPGTLRFFMRDSATNYLIDQAWSPSADIWYHIAIVRSGLSFYTFVDGTQLGSTITEAHVPANYTGTLNIGRVASNTDIDMLGWLDEFRWVKGTAIWTSNFTSPAAAYTKTTSIKSINGLAYASIKSRNGLAIGSIKSHNGLA